MKLMLTSAGVRNDSLREAFRELVGGKDMRIAFIPTGANLEEGDKGWVIDDLNDCRKLGVVDIVDISAIEKSEWLPRLEWANVIFVEGGNTDWLMKWIVRSGLADELRDLLRERVYVGASAGSMVLSKTLFASSEFIDLDKRDCPVGLGYIDFDFRPHLNFSSFPKSDKKFLREISGKFDVDLYAMDNESGIVWVDGEIEIVGEGKWVKFSGKKKVD